MPRRTALGLLSLAEPPERTAPRPGKAAASAAYARTTARIPCRHYDGGRGDCPFGSSCHYAHIRPDGTEHVYTRPPLRIDADGGVSVKRAARLSDFIFG